MYKHRPEGTVYSVLLHTEENIVCSGELLISLQKAALDGFGYILAGPYCT